MIDQIRFNRQEATVSNIEDIAVIRFQQLR